MSGFDADAALDEALRVLLPASAAFADPWCVIGSAALRLHGVGDVVPQDLDLLTSRRDAQALEAHWWNRLDTHYRPPGSDRFRSHFARFRAPGLAVEVMGGLEVLHAGRWRAVRSGRLRAVARAGVAVPVPEPAALAAMLRLFGRDKDLARLRLLERLPPRSMTPGADGG